MARRRFCSARRKPRSRRRGSFGRATATGSGPRGHRPTAQPVGRRGHCRHPAGLGSARIDVEGSGALQHRRAADLQPVERSTLRSSHHASLRITAGHLRMSSRPWAEKIVFEACSITVRLCSTRQFAEPRPAPLKHARSFLTLLAVFDVHLAQCLVRSCGTDVGPRRSLRSASSAASAWAETFRASASELARRSTRRHSSPLPPGTQSTTWQRVPPDPGASRRMRQGGYPAECPSLAQGQHGAGLFFRSPPAPGALRIPSIQAADLTFADRGQIRPRVSLEVNRTAVIATDRPAGRGST